LVEKELFECIENMKAAISIAFGNNLPEYDPAFEIINGQEELEGTAVIMFISNSRLEKKYLFPKKLVYGGPIRNSCRVKSSLIILERMKKPKFWSNSKE
jgi:hypothetical protein